MNTGGNDTSERQRLRAIVDGGFDPFYVLEAVRDETNAIIDFVYVDLNLRAAERVKKPREQIIGRRVTEIFSEEQVRPFIAKYAGVIESGHPHEEETPLTLLGAAVTWVRYHATPLGDSVAITARDISKQKADEVALRGSHSLLEQRVAERTAELTLANAELTNQIAQRRRAEDRFTRLSNSGLLAISISDESGRVFEVNDAFAKLVGYTREELLAPGFDGKKLIPPEYAEASARSQRDLQTHGVAEPHEREFVRKDGTRVSVLLGVAMLGPTELVVCANDLTTTKQAVEALRQAEEQLRQSQKLEAIGSLAGGVAHDFNNLLSVILSYGEMIESGLNKDDPMRGDIAEIVAAGRRAAELTKQLLAFSRKQILKPRSVALDSLVSGLERMLRRLIGENIEFTVLRSQKLSLVKVDPGQVEQVVMNLVVNARDAMPSGGKLIIETSNVFLDEDYARQHPEVVPGQHVMIAVSDNGTGMDAATRARVFDPFFTTKGQGTGLGLSTAFGIVKQSGGHLWVYSEPGAGATFKAYFPCDLSVEDDAEVAGIVDVVNVRGSETILLVEDEEQVRVLARTVLERHGYHVLEAQSGGDALLLCERHTARIDLLLTDVVMPRMTGRQLADRLLSVRGDMKVLYTSGYTDNSIVHHGVLDSGINFLEKPLTADSLTRKVRSVLDAPRSTKNG